MICKIFSAIFLGLFLSVAAFAQLEDNPENWCRNGLFPRENGDFRIAKIKGAKGEKVYFYGDDEDCPNGKNCRTKSYVIPGNEVIVSRTYGNFVCSWFQPAKGSETVGWIKAEKLEFKEAASSPKLSDWLGYWWYYDNSIEIIISKKRGLLGVKGQAYWKGLGDNIHVGELEEETAPRGNLLKIGEKETDEFACKVTMRLLDKYLIVSDNLNCGGVNVTFTGVYRRKSTK